MEHIIPFHPTMQHHKHYPHYIHILLTDGWGVAIQGREPAPKTVVPEKCEGRSKSAPGGGRKVQRSVRNITRSRRDVKLLLLIL